MSNNFQKSSQVEIDFLIDLLGIENVLFDAESLQEYGHDETEDFVFSPEIVAKPNSTDQVSKILRYCNENNIPVTPQGARTGLSGGALPLFGGIAISMERFNNIIENTIKCIR